MKIVRPRGFSMVSLLPRDTSVRLVEGPGHTIGRSFKLPLCARERRESRGSHDRRPRLVADYGLSIMSVSIDIHLSRGLYTPGLIVLRSRSPATSTTLLCPRSHTYTRARRVGSALPDRRR